MIGSDEKYIGEVSNIAFGGEGIIRHEGLVVFVPFAAIGDTIRFRITKKKKNFASGQIVEILKPSPQRVSPKCPYFGTCGGCQLQHLNYNAQLECKRQWIEDAFRRVAGLKNIVIPQVIPASQQWDYRRRIVLTLKPSQNHYIAGYVGVEGTSLVEVNRCPIFCSQTDRVVEYAQEIFHQLICDDENEARGTILKQNDKYLLHFHFRKMPNNGEEVFKQALSKYTELSGIIASSPGKTIQLGTHTTSLEIEGLSFDFSAQAFLQSHSEQSLNIYREICSLTAKLQAKKILDLYSGIGISSLLLAKQGCDVVGIEANAEAVRLANANAKKNEITTTRFISAYVEHVLEAELKRIKPDLVIVNPPREGLAAAAIDQLIAHPAPQLIYISCMPPTLARDIKLLSQAGYQVKSVQGYDMFPQTTHVETLVTASLV